MARERVDGAALAAFVEAQMPNLPKDVNERLRRLQELAFEAFH